MLEAQLQGIDEPVAVFGIEAQPVDEDIQGPGLGRAGLFQGNGRPVAQQPVEAQLLQGPVAFLGRPGKRHRQDRSGRKLEQGLGHGVDGIAPDRAPALQAVDGADAGVQHAQIIIGFGDGGHRGAGILGGRFLLDGDGRGDAVDQVRVGLVHPFQELAGIGGERLDVAALALGVQGVERQGRFSRAAHAGDDDELVQGHVQTDILEIVDTDAPQEDVFVHRSSRMGVERPPEMRYYTRFGLDRTTASLILSRAEIN